MTYESNILMVFDNNLHVVYLKIETILVEMIKEVKD